MKNTSRSFTLAALALMGVLCLSAPTRAQTLRAAPQTVTIPPAQASAKATIAWDAGDANPDAEVWFQVDNEDEERFSGEAKGTLAATILPGKTYTFKLYKDESGQNVLATVVVTGVAAGAGNADNAGGVAPAAPPDGGAAPVSFAGAWDTVSDRTHKFTVILQQNSNQVTGTYSPNNGKIEGVVKDNILRFKWNSNSGKGSGRFVMNEDNQSFSGSYNNGDDPEKVEGIWSGKRQGAGGEGNAAGGEGTAAPVSFAGTWKVTGALLPLTFKLQQTGDQVKGEYRADILISNTLSVQDGKVVEKTLRFKALLPNGTPLGSGEFVMDEGGKSFKGTLIGRAVTGTRQDQ